MLVMVMVSCLVRVGDGVLLVLVMVMVSCLIGVGDGVLSRWCW